MEILKCKYCEGWFTDFELYFLHLQICEGVNDMEEELVKEIERLTEENERLQIAFDSVLDRYSDAHQERVKLRDKLREMEIK